MNGNQRCREPMKPYYQDQWSTIYLRVNRFRHIFVSKCSVPPINKGCQRRLKEHGKPNARKLRSEKPASFVGSCVFGAKVQQVGSTGKCSTNPKGTFPSYPAVCDLGFASVVLTSQRESPGVNRGLSGRCPRGLSKVFPVENIYSTLPRLLKSKNIGSEKALFIDCGERRFSLEIITHASVAAIVVKSGQWSFWRPTIKNPIRATKTCALKLAMD